MTAVRGTAPRVVSLVPSLTEAVAVTAPGLLVGATDWCGHWGEGTGDVRAWPAPEGPGPVGAAPVGPEPVSVTSGALATPAGLDVVRIGGTKNPDVAAIAALRPDLVLANEEENRAPDLAALRAAGLDVLVTEIRTLDQGLRELERVLAACGAPRRPRWLVAAEAAWEAVTPPAPRTAVVPIWRRPWMVLGSDTFAGDLLARLGVRNVYADHPDRYPKIPLDELRAAGPELVVLPDEPYRFTRDDGPEAFPGTAAALVDGRMLTWYGPSLAEAPQALARALRAAHR